MVGSGPAAAPFSLRACNPVWQATLNTSSVYRSSALEEISFSTSGVGQILSLPIKGKALPCQIPEHAYFRYQDSPAFFRGCTVTERWRPFALQGQRSSEGGRGAQIFAAAGYWPGLLSQDGGRQQACLASLQHAKPAYIPAKLGIAATPCEGYTLTGLLCNRYVAVVAQGQQRKHADTGHGCRDIKLENALLDRNKRLLKITDFGYAKTAADSLPKSEVGTPNYAGENVGWQHYQDAAFLGCKDACHLVFVIVTLSVIC